MPVSISTYSFINLFLRLSNHNLLYLICLSPEAIPCDYLLFFEESKVLEGRKLPQQTFLLIYFFPSCVFHRANFPKYGKVMSSNLIKTRKGLILSPSESEFEKFPQFWSGILLISACLLAPSSSLLSSTAPLSLSSLYSLARTPLPFSPPTLPPPQCGLAPPTQSRVSHNFPASA